MFQQLSILVHTLSMIILRQHILKQLNQTFVERESQQQREKFQTVDLTSVTQKKL